MSRAMKNSSIPWIGEIPEKWKTDSIGSLYSLRTEKVSDKDYCPLSVGKMGVVPQLENIAKTDAGNNRKLVKVGDFAINSRSDRRGSCGISAYEGSVSHINMIITPRSEMYPQYYNWLFHTELFADEFYKWGHGIVDDLWTTRWQEMKRISIVLPPLTEQRLIADFLDRKCAEIDEMIALQEEMINELNAYKQSVITETVTHGIVPNTPMKDSGIEWIGVIPKRWEITKIKYLSDGLTDGTHDTFKQTEHGRFLLSSKNVRDTELQITDNEFMISESDYNSVICNGFPQKNDLLLCCIGASIGRCIIYQYDEIYAFQRSVIFIRCNKRILPSLLRYNLLSSNSILQESFLINQSAQAGLYQGQVKEILVIVPPLSEQRDIADYLDEKCAEIDALITLKNAKINELKYYKKSIIYEYVTGKKEV